MTDARTDELARAFAVFNEATESLQRSHDVLTARVAALQAELVEKNKQLARRERLALLGEMAAGVAHEIRNPLGGIELYAGLLRRELAEQPSSEALVAKILSGTRHLNRIVEDLLTYTRQLSLERGPCRLEGVVDDALSDAAAVLEGRPIAVVRRFPGEGLRAIADPHQLRRAVTNLVSNAVQAMSTGGTLTLEGASTDGEVCLSVADTGCGIPDEEREKIFHPFFTSKPRGTGLGLALVHRIVEAHGARIEVESAVGVGTTVSLWLPGDAP